MLSLAVNNADAKSVFQSYMNSYNCNAPGIDFREGGADFAAIFQAAGQQGANAHYIVKPNKTFQRVMQAGMVEALGLSKHQCGGGVDEFTLEVSSGSGDGEHEEGATITISANSAPNGKVFDKWTGDTQYLADPSSKTTTVTMPAKNISVTATYKDIEVITYTLKVNAGSGDGEHAKDAVVTITADDAPEGQKFDKWTGDVDGIADVNSATTSLTMPAKNVTITAEYKDKGPVVKTDNYMVISTWESGADELGSVVTIDSSAKADTVLAASIALGKSNLTAKEYAWAQISGYADGDFSEVSSVELVYSANNPVNIVLNQEGLSETGESYFFQLPPADEEKVTIAISDFKQPSWVSSGNKTELELSKVGSLSFSAVTESKTTDIKIQGIFMDGFLENTPIVESGDAVKSNALYISSISANQISLGQCLKGDYAVSIFNLSGKKLISQKKSVKDSSDTTIDFGRKMLTSGAYIVTIKSAHRSFAKRVVVK